MTPKRSVSLLCIAAMPIVTLAIILTLFANPAPVRAATFILGTDCPTLQDCITAAMPGDVIEVPAGTYITTAVINKALTINGADMATTILDGNNAGRVLDIPIAVPVTLTNITLQNGNTTGLGGAIFAGTNLVLENVTIRDNIASNGGGIWSEGPIDIRSSLITNNVCTDAGCFGGGIYARTTASFTGTNLISNTASLGGGIMAGGAMTATNSLFQFNSGNGINGGAALLLQNSQVMANSGQTGGGVRSGGHFAAIDSVIQDNICTDAGCRGGGIHALATAAITGTQVLSNTGGTGGGLWAYSDVVISDTTFTNNHCIATGCIGGAVYTNGRFTGHSSTFSGNSAQSDGGAIGSVGLLSLYSTDFTSNSAPQSAGAVWAFAAAVVDGGTFVGNDCTAVDCLGGALSILGSSTVANAHFQENNAWFGGGAISANQIAITNTTFITNEATLNGGGVYAQAALSLSNVDFTDNVATSGGGASAQTTAQVSGGTFRNNIGGGIIASSDIAVTGTTFRDNVADEGGGVHANATASLNGAIFIDNRCGAAACRGGGFYVALVATISDTDFISNTAEFAGGGLWANQTVTLTNSLVEGNTCTLVACSGGGVYSNGAIVVTGTSVISGNHALGDGGGLYSFNTIDLNGATLINNQANGNGGGLWANGAVQVNGATIVGNQSLVQGGGLYAIGNVTLLNSQVITNAADFNGGGLSIGGTLAVTDSTFSGNASGTQGGAAWVNGDITTSGGSVSHNTSAGPAGGFFGQTNASINGTLFTNNYATGSAGGLGLGGTAVISDATFTDNETAGHGGGVNAVSVIAHNSTFSGNIASQNGGGVFGLMAVSLYNSDVISNLAGFSGGGVRGADVLLQDTTFTENSCQGSPCVGGAVASGINLAIGGSEFISNTTTGIGGALYIVGSAQISHTIFLANHAELSGGAAYHDIHGASSYENVVLARNVSPGAGAALYLNNGAVATVNHATIVGNDDGMGEGIWINNGTLNMLNSIVTHYGTGVMNDAVASIESSVFWGNSLNAAGITLPASNFLMNPRFAAPISDNFSLSPGSVAIDNAQPTAVISDVVGNARPFGAGNDIGAYESPFLKDQLSIQVSMLPEGGLLPGQPVSYTIVYANSGAVFAYDIDVESMLPVELVDVAFASSHPITQTGSADFSWAVGDLPPMTSRVITVTGRVDPTLTAELPFTHTVQIRSDNATMLDNAVGNVALPNVEFMITEVTVAETAGQVVLTLELSGANPYAPIVIDIATADGTAVAGEDYQALAAMVMIPAGSGTQLFEVIILHNIRMEETETFTINITGGAGAIPSGTVTMSVSITDDDKEFYVPVVLTVPPE